MISFLIPAGVRGTPVAKRCSFPPHTRIGRNKGSIAAWWRRGGSQSIGGRSGGAECARTGSDCVKERAASCAGGHVIAIAGTPAMPLHSEAQ
jgi:hypothetical protein